MKHLKKFKMFENTESQTYIFTPDENLLKMVQDCGELWGKEMVDHENSMMSLTGDRSNFPFTGSKKTHEKEEQVLDAAVKAGYKPTPPIQKPYKFDDYENFIKAIAPSFNSSESFIFESKDGRPKLYNGLVRPLKDLYNESDDETKETFKYLSNDLFRNPKDIVNMFTGKISKFKTLDELTKSLKSFLKAVDDLKK